LLLVTAAISVWAVGGAHQAQVAEAHWNEVLAAARHLEAIEWAGDQPTYQRLFSEAAAAVEAEPDNVHYRHWLAAYKWQSLRLYADPNSGQLDSRARPWVAEIIDDLDQARALCPTYGATACLTGEIKKFFLGDPSGTEDIEQGYRLAPCDATTCFAAARVDAEDGEAERAFDKLARAIQLDGAYFQPAAELCLEGLARPDLALELAADNPGRLGWVANLLAASEAHSELVAQARAHAIELLRERSDDPDAPASTQVSMARHEATQGDLDSAIERYRAALRKDYDQYAWHYELAGLLARAGQTDDAKHEAEICLRLRPDYQPAVRLIEQLVVLPPADSGPLASGR
jgi:tetratricopeptide (TPR) repeat protein